MPSLLDRLNFSWSDLSYLVNLTGIDIVRLKDAPDLKALYNHAQAVHGKLKAVQGATRKPNGPPKGKSKGVGRKLY